MHLGILGLGKMGEAIARGLVASSHAKSFKITATLRNPAAAKEAAKRLGISCQTDNLPVAKASDVLLICVKPFQVKDLLKEISPALTKDKLIISIAAGLTLAQLKEWSGGRAAVLRSMPNTPALLGAGVTVYSVEEGAKDAHIATAEKIFQSIGISCRIDEALMDGATGLSGCGPAYVYLIIEALSEGGVRVGLQRETATLLAAQTLLGAAKMVLERGVHPAALKDEVTTPAGCTIEGLMALEEGGLRVTLVNAILAAAEKSRRLRGA